MLDRSLGWCACGKLRQEQWNTPEAKTEDKKSKRRVFRFEWVEASPCSRKLLITPTNGQGRNNEELKLEKNETMEQDSKSWAGFK